MHLWALAWAHSTGHGEVRHDLMVRATEHNVVLEAIIELPQGVEAHDPALNSNGWLVSGLDLHSGRATATFQVTGDGRRRTATGTLPWVEGDGPVFVSDGTLLSERTLLRWTLSGPSQVTAPELEVFDGQRRRSIDGDWVRESPRHLTLTRNPQQASSRWWWWAAAAAAALLLAILRGALRGRQQGPS